MAVNLRRHPRPPRLHRRGRALARRPRRGRAGAVLGRGRAAAERGDLAGAAPHRRARPSSSSTRSTAAGADVDARRGAGTPPADPAVVPLAQCARPGRAVTPGSPRSPLRRRRGRGRGRRGRRRTSRRVGRRRPDPASATSCAVAAPRRADRARRRRVLCGSAITGAGTAQLRERAHPAAAAGRRRRPGPTAGTVFAVDRDERGRRAWVRLWSGELRVRDKVAVGGARPAPVTEVSVSAPPAGLTPGPSPPPARSPSSAGRSPRIGDTIGRPPPRRRTHRFAPATLEALVEPGRPDPAHRPLRRAGRARRRGPADRAAVRRDRRRGGGEPARRGAEGGDRRAAGGALRRRGALLRHLGGLPRAGGRQRARRSTGSASAATPTSPSVGLRVEAAAGRARRGVLPGRRARQPAAGVRRGDRGGRARRRCGRARTAGRSPTAW